MFENVDRLIPVFQKAYQSSQDLESGLLAIRETGASQAESVLVLNRVMQLPLSEADAMVLESRTWQDQHAATIALREQMFDFIGDGSESKG